MFLQTNEEAIFSLLLASGYLKVLEYENMADIPANRNPLYELTITNHEVRRMFLLMVRSWFDR